VNLLRMIPWKRKPLKVYAEELGWQSRTTNDGLVHTGNYRAAGLKYSGWILEKVGGKFQFFIHNPPIKLLRSTDFAGCFHACNDGWYLIAFKPHSVPAEISSGIAAVQKALRNAFEVRVSTRIGRA
jgi:hypothetical protein